MSEDQTKYCPYCGIMIPYDERYCPACGEPQPALGEVVKKTTKKSPWLAALLSLLITGLGQLYLGKWRRGASFFFTAIMLGFFASFYLTNDQILVIGVIFAIISAYDAYRLTSKPV
jgi:TM2 domain-containing membrane protein YozV